MVVQLPPPFRDNWMSTLPATLEDAQVISLVVPTSQLTGGPLGIATVMLEAGAAVMLKLPLLTSKIAGLETLITFILALLVTGAVTVQARLPLLSVEGMMVAQSVPPFRDNWMSTLPATLRDVQVIGRLVPTSQLPPPLGEITVMVLII